MDEHESDKERIAKFRALAGQKGQETMGVVMSLETCVSLFFHGKSVHIPMRCCNTMRPWRSGLQRLRLARICLRQHTTRFDRSQASCQRFAVRLIFPASEFEGTVLGR
jgi:hypothetical protein